MPSRPRIQAAPPRWRAMALGGLVVALGALMATVGAFAAGGTTVRCSRGASAAVSCAAESTRWLGRSTLGLDPIGTLEGVSSRVVERHERNPDSRDPTRTTRKRADWYLVLGRTKAAPWEVAGTRDQVEDGVARLRALLDDPARRDASATLDDWAFAWAAMGAGVLVALGGARMVVRAR